LANSSFFPSLNSFFVRQEKRVAFAKNYLYTCIVKNSEKLRLFGGLRSWVDTHAYDERIRESISSSVLEPAINTLVAKTGPPENEV
jgi:hypothetical protein